MFWKRRLYGGLFALVATTLLVLAGLGLTLAWTPSRASAEQYAVYSAYIEDGLTGESHSLGDRRGTVIIAADSALVPEPNTFKRWSFMAESMLFTACLFLLRGVALGQGEVDAPIKTTLCEVKREPDRFNGKIIQVRARIFAAFEYSNLIDDSCAVRTWLSWGDQPIVSDKYGKDVPVEFAYMKSRSEVKHPERLNWFAVGKPPITLIEDDSSRTAEQFLAQFYATADDLSACPGFCPKYRVLATVTGRFDFISKRRLMAVREVATGRVEVWEKANGFGHLGVSDSKLVLQSVSDVVAELIDRSVYVEKGRR